MAGPRCSRTGLEPLRGAIGELSVRRHHALMITKSQVIPMLVEASPSFQAEVDKHLAIYEEEIRSE